MKIILENIKILRKTDIVLIAAFLIFAVMFYFIFDLSSPTGDTVVIKLNGIIYAEVSLNENKDIEIYPDNGASSNIINTVRIQDKKVFMIYADCPDKLCMKHKPVDSDSDVNDMIVCLPNRVTVEIKSSGKSKEFDAVISAKAPF